MTRNHADNTSESTWIIRHDAYSPRDEGRREAVFALGNGIFVVRAAAHETTADSIHYPGTYRAGCYNRLASQIEGERVETESLVNLPNWLVLQYRIEDGPWFHPDRAKVLDYCHELDLKRGMTRREFIFRDECGRHTRVREYRILSMAEPYVGALRLELTPLDWSGRITLHTAIDGDVVNDNVARYADYEKRHLDILVRRVLPDKCLLLQVQTKHSLVRIAQATRTMIEGEQADSPEDVEENPRSIAHLLHARASAGQTVAVDKIAAIYTSLDGAEPGEEAHSRLRMAGGFSAIRAAHERSWEELWSRTAIDVDNGEAARTLRLHAFHILQTISPHTAKIDAGIPARGWHGEGYHGHIFWDELFVFPFLNFRFPMLAKELLLYRYRRLDAARRAAREAGYRGAMYPWRSAGDGQEVTPTHQKNLLNGQWMRDHTYLQRHIGSAIAFNIWQYYLTTGGDEFMSEYGAEMMLEIARFWASIARLRKIDERFEIRGVIGPDEYHNAYPHSDSPGLDNNAYTNVMAVWTLCRALEVLELLPAGRRAEIVQGLDLNDSELVLWERISRAMHVPFHGDGIVSQFEGFERLAEFRPDVLPPSLADERADWALRTIGQSPDEYQLTKQADTLTLFYLLPEDEVAELFNRLGYTFDRGCMRRTANYYLDRTTHRSSLSRIVYAGGLAQLDPGLSWQLYEHALHTDLNTHKPESTAEGIHLGAMAGTLDILQRRYLGICACKEGLRVDPALPPKLGEVRLALRYRNNEIDITGSAEEVQVASRISNREAITVLHGGMTSRLEPGSAITVGRKQ